MTTDFSCHLLQPDLSTVDFPAIGVLRTCSLGSLFGLFAHVRPCSFMFAVFAYVRPVRLVQVPFYRAGFCLSMACERDERLSIASERNEHLF
jgi:hypothetical protein